MTVVVEVHFAGPIVEVVECLFQLDDWDGRAIGEVAEVKGWGSLWHSAHVHCIESK